MGAFSFSPSVDTLTAVSRWFIYYRLKELGISCRCSSYEALVIDLASPCDLVQVWSVCRQMETPKAELMDWLDRCWQQDSVPC